MVVTILVIGGGMALFPRAVRDTLASPQWHGVVRLT
jgi:hypothetical protein